MKIRCLSVGKASDSAIQILQDAYSVRLSRWANVAWELIPPSAITSLDSAQILKRIQPKDFVVLLDERGQQKTTPEMAVMLDNWLGSSRPLVFVIGGAYGVDDVLRTRADYVWSLSKLVFPHQLVRVLLSEQLYRLFSVRAGGKYHHN